MMTPPQGIDLDQYRTQAKELKKQLLAAQPEALDRLRHHHPEFQSRMAAAGIRLTDAQLVIARENGFSSWTKFRAYLLFRKAVQALDAGDLPTLEALLNAHPFLLRYRCYTGEDYEEGYFAGATLLNHIAGNPLRCPLPPNILEVTRLLLRQGARDLPPYSRYTLGLLLTSRAASEAGVALPLMDLLMEARGEGLDWAAPDLLDGPLGEEAYATATALLQRGARMNLCHAAALGRLDLVERLVQADGNPLADASLIPLSADSHEAKAQKEQAFIEACRCGQTLVAAFLLEQEIDPSSQGVSGQTGLHYAAHSGHLETVQMLLEHHVPVEVKNMYGGTVLGQALWSAFNEPRADHLPIIEALIAAGARIAPSWNPQIDALRQGAIV